MMAGALGIHEEERISQENLCSPAELQRPLYPPTLLTFAKNNKVELQKLEKRINALIADKKVNSCQLKPMNPSIRNAVHGISRYYLLNSFVYDAEPRTYVSLVKTPDSSVPSLSLSAASTLSVLPPPSILATYNTPSLYISLNNPRAGFAVTDTNDNKGKKVPPSELNLCSGGNVTVGDAVNRVISVLKAHNSGGNSNDVKDVDGKKYSSYNVVTVAAVGPSSVSFSFSNIPAAFIAYSVLQTYKSLKPLGNSTINNSTRSHEEPRPGGSIPLGLVEMFSIEASFDCELYAQLQEIEEQVKRIQETEDQVCICLYVY
jgi:hypothetical protein